MRAEEAANAKPNDHSLAKPLQNSPPIQNGLGTPNGAQSEGVDASPDLPARTPVTPALPRRGYHPHARPPGARPSRTGTAGTRPSGPELVFDPDVSAAPLFTSLLVSSVPRPWYRALAESFRRENLPPLELTSTPVPVASIWGTYNFRKRSLFSSGLAHIALVVVLFTAISRAPLPRTMRQSIDLSIPIDIARFVPTPPQQGGGGGGENSPLPANEGPLPRFQLVQLAPPRPQAMNVEPRLSVRPSLLIPDDMRANVLDLSLLGSPLHEVSPPSPGAGKNGGIGEGDGGGVGDGKGGGFGPQKSAGSEGVLDVGGEVSAPLLKLQVDPEYSEQARAQRVQGAVLLSIEVWPDGRAHNVRVVRGLGMGLDERAVEAVTKWQFEPGTKDGEPVPVICRVEVIFQLF